MVMVNLLYVPFGALMLVMYDKAVCRVISNRYNGGSEAEASKSQ